MGLFDFFWRLFSPRPSRPGPRPLAPKRRRKPCLVPLRRKPAARPGNSIAPFARQTPPYAFARLESAPAATSTCRRTGRRALARLAFPVFHTPEQLAAGSSCQWAAWPGWCIASRKTLARRTRPQAHYHIRWIGKRRGGRRLIESPKRTLKTAQKRILREILDKVPPHDTAHGFAAGRSILTNAKPHVKQAVLVKFDLDDFYPSVTLSRVTAIFRSLGYSREAAIWLARLTDLGPARQHALRETRTLGRVALSQTTSAARRADFAGARQLVGLFARRAIVGPGPLVRRDLHPLCRRSHILRTAAVRHVAPRLSSRSCRKSCGRSGSAERRQAQGAPLSGRLVVTGVVVNEKPNVARCDFDRLKAVLTNCLRQGPSTQNQAAPSALRRPCARTHRANDPAQSGPRAPELLAIYNQIDWNR